MLNFQEMTVPELKAMAKNSGLTGYSKMRKQELIELLEKSSKLEIETDTVEQTAVVEVPDADPELMDMVKKEVQEISSMFKGNRAQRRKKAAIEKKRRKLFEKKWNI